MLYDMKQSGNAELWVADELLASPPDGFFGFGANGAARRGDDLYVINTDRGLIARIPIQKDGTAGEPTVYAEDPLLFGGDGLAFDVLGNLYVPRPFSFDLVRVTPCKTVESIVDFGDTLPFGTNIEFGVGRDSKTVFVWGRKFADSPFASRSKAETRGGS